MNQKDSLTWLRYYWPDVVTMLALLAALIVSGWYMAGCASTKVTPAENASKVSQTDSPPSKKVKLTIGQQVQPGGGK